MTIDWTKIDSIERARALVTTNVGPGASRDEIAAFLGAGGITAAHEDEEDGIIRARIDGPSPEPSVQIRWLLEFHLDDTGQCAEATVEESFLAP